MADRMVAFPHQSGKASAIVDKSLIITWLQGIGIFLTGFVIAFALLTSIDGFVSNDDYYHSRIASQMLEQRTLRLDFPWLPLTILSADRFVDHHLLYHLYLAPWVYWGGIVGAKIAQALVIGGLFTAFWSLLRSLKVNYTLIWSMGLLAVSVPFLYRLLMIRTQAAALLILLLGLQCLFRRKYVWLIFLSFAFTWLFNGFILLPVLVVLYTFAHWISSRQILWQPLVYTLIGMSLGLIINPYFPQNIRFILDHLGAKVDIESGIRVGSEWYPYTTGALLEHSPGALLVLAVGLLKPALRKSGYDRIETTLLLVALVTLYMTFESRRFIEYYPAFALLFCAVTWGRESIDLRNAGRFNVRSTAVRLTMAMAFVPLILLTWTTISRSYDDVRTAENFSYMAGASEWLKENAEPDTLIFQIDWDDFPYLFFHNTQNTYLIGLDPTYLQAAYPDLWSLWVPITDGDIERPASLIRDRFGAAYVVSDTHHEDFAQHADNDPEMQLVYRDAYSLIWQIRSPEMKEETEHKQAEGQG